jgi:hypothetical protein
MGRGLGAGNQEAAVDDLVPAAVAWGFNRCHANSLTDFTVLPRELSTGQWVLQGAGAKMAYFANASPNPSNSTGTTTEGGYSR